MMFVVFWFSDKKLMKHEHDTVTQLILLYDSSFICTSSRRIVQLLCTFKLLCRKSAHVQPKLHMCSRFPGFLHMLCKICTCARRLCKKTLWYLGPLLEVPQNFLNSWCSHVLYFCSFRNHAETLLSIKLKSTIPTLGRVVTIECRKVFVCRGLCIKVSCFCLL